MLFWDEKHIWQRLVVLLFSMGDNKEKELTVGRVEYLARRNLDHQEPSVADDDSILK